ncbi:hypothetical protein AERO9AM_10468 [Aeromicrobium sp. 9AM]|nr:hypothetical protein AERO9AM_10468 [Aeromicrobium sp. 9AM]
MRRVPQWWGTLAAAIGNIVLLRLVMLGSALACRARRPRPARRRPLQWNAHPVGAD